MDDILEVENYMFRAISGHRQVYPNYVLQECLYNMHKTFLVAVVTLLLLTIHSGEGTPQNSRGTFYWQLLASYIYTSVQAVSVLN
jgi:hypothetical protein